jgi:hypothetical protein
VFPQSNAGQPDCAFRKMNTPMGACLPAIQDAVAKGYWVRTRSEEPISTVRSNDTWSRREAAFASGAQIVSTDFPTYGMSARWGRCGQLQQELPAARALQPCDRPREL